ncbi:TetR/AcrR family transcriptional regulator [Planococcus salinus]|uniref:TetR/AcrR family transcriptional regulator n=1 Tax=Planococcus salinus TaxID=1848460 RepID=A0A3M8P424_9BACL|nr:TetR/AcrR family transcriptional regulator [Planococcus salinus]RNF38429.1 TetR/AcrR family transcriptional regulator [Planococcus salinus]
MNPKKQKIINAAYALFISKGYNASSIQDILDEAGVSKGTFYNYFASKTECLIAIMESIGSEIRQKRMAAALGKPVDDLDVLAEQLCIRIRLNREKNLFALYESIFYSQDEELKKYAKDTYVTELNWISSRIVDVFGKEAEAFALENAAIVHGSIQQLNHIWKLSSTDDLPTKELAAFVIRRLKTAVTHQIETGDAFIRQKQLPVDRPAETISAETLSSKLKTYAETSGDNESVQQLTRFLSEEISGENPRKALVESVLSSLATHSSSEPELSALLESVWHYLNGLQQKS